MYAVMVKPTARKKICSARKVWVKDDYYEFYVNINERGLWKTKSEAETMITESWEVVIEAHNAELTGRGLESCAMKPYYNRAPVERTVRLGDNHNYEQRRNNN